MNKINTKSFIEAVLANMPKDWANLTTHRLDIYKEELAKLEFLERLEALFIKGDHSAETLQKELTNMPTAYDYIRLGHPLSCILEWQIAKERGVNTENIISFSSQTMPILAVLRSNLLQSKSTRIVHKCDLPINFDISLLKSVYGYDFEVSSTSDVDSNFDGSTLVITSLNDVSNVELTNDIDFLIGIDSELGSVILVNSENSEYYVSEIQHVRRRESIAMTPDNCLKGLGGKMKSDSSLLQENKTSTLNTIKSITSTSSDASLGSCGLAIQYAVIMGLIHHARDKHSEKDIKLIVPPNCYGGTNDQARRVAACISNVEVLDLAVDSGQDMVQSVEEVLAHVADLNAVPFIIAEIPTNPRVEVPDLDKLREALSKPRRTKNGEESIAPVFILDQTFCPNMQFLGDKDILSGVKTISYVSGSKFPSGGLCTAGYCVSNTKADEYMDYIDNHLKICDNEATNFQIEILSKQMSSMNERIELAYENTRSFVNYIHDTLPEAKINFVSNELAEMGFTPSVFSLDLPTKGEGHEERETYKRELNLKLITMMVKEIPEESKHCVSYGQLKGCYWTIPATSTQGTTREGDKDYIVRVSIAPEFNLELHKKVFSEFCINHV